MRLNTRRVSAAFIVLVCGAVPVHSRASLARPADPPNLKDIVEARSIDGLSLSPNGHWLAYRVLTPSLRDNQILAQWFLVSANNEGGPRAVGPATEPILYPEFDLEMDPEVLWAKDSSAFVTRLERGSQIQLYLLQRTGQWRQLTHDAADVQRVSVDRQGRGLSYQVARARSDITRLQGRQESQGIHFDRGIYPEGLPLTHNFRIGDRWTTIRRSEPPIDADIGREAFAGALRTKRINAPIPLKSARSPDDQTPLDPWEESDLSRTVAVDPSGGMARLQATDNKRGGTVLAIEASAGPGPIKLCQAAFCQGSFKALREVTVDPETGDVVTLFEKNFSARSALFAWNPRSDAVRTIYQPDGALTGGSNFQTGPCPRAGRFLFCVESGPTRPDHVIRIDLTSGDVRALADPNTALATKNFPLARYLEWTDADGRPANGILMMPPKQALPAPLVITTYRCRGFLRGGVAMVVPEPILVQRGFAALCVNNNDDALDDRAGDGTRIPAAGAKAALASYTAIITQLAADNIVDPKRVGISGHSFSANSIAYGISHSDLFAAAVMSGGTTMDPMSYAVTAPMPDSLRKGVFANLGLPAPDNDPLGLWREVSPALNANAVRAALLMQPPENEWLFTLQFYTAIRDAGGIADMFVYPHAGHDANRYPQQHYWRNRRSLDWFSYWLQPNRQRSLLTAAELGQWDALRLRRKPDRDD